MENNRWVAARGRRNALFCTLTMNAKTIQKTLRTYASKKRAETNAWFFKTGKGEYGEGDRFIGVSNPDARKVALRYRETPLATITELLNSNIHEDRFVALEILVAQFEHAVKQEDKTKQKKIATYYLKQRARINNWDLVDTSASYILGQYLFDKDRTPLYRLARSKSLWDRRIAVVATHYAIRQKDFVDTCALAVLLIDDKEDLIHKAVGWMLREVGKQDEMALVSFLEVYATSLPRTTLRYALERLSDVQKKQYMKR